MPESRHPTLAVLGGSVADRFDHRSVVLISNLASLLGVAASLGQLAFITGPLAMGLLAEPFGFVGWTAVRVPALRRHRAVEG